MTAELTHHLNLCLAAIRAAEAGPTPEELALAPLMETWRVLLSPEGAPVLWGKVIDHPRLGTAMITTSRLVTLSLEQGHARSLSRWFRLGMPYPTATRRPGALRNQATRSLEDFEASAFTALHDADELSRILIDFAARAKALPRAADLEHHRSCT